MGKRTTRRGAIRRRSGHWAQMARLGIKMMFHDRAKLAGTLLGVVFATVLMIQQLGVFGGLLYKNTQFVDNATADLWVVPPATEQLASGCGLISIINASSISSSSSSPLPLRPNVRRTSFADDSILFFLFSLKGVFLPLAQQKM